MNTKRNNIMKFKKFISYFKFNESFKETRLNQILDKLSNRTKLTKQDQDFLDNYSQINDEDLMDYKMLSKESTYERINSLLMNDKKVICNLHDRDGRIGLEIKSIKNDFQTETSILTLKNGEKIELKDNILYNILHNQQKNEWSLEMEDEFFEKIPIDNEN
jgi:hypothetical protein